jgi:outer membrane receptor for ferrienterochelin and colicin
MISLNFKPNNRLQLGVDFSKETFWEKRGGDELWDYNVVQQRTTYQISKTLSLRAIVDYNFFYKEVLGSFLVSYVLRPGTVFFLGFDSNYLRDEFGKYDRQNYSIFLKFSYWWRV